MRQLPALLLGLAWLLPAGAALAEDPPAAPPAERDGEALASELDRVVREALEQGLLAPVGETGAPAHEAPAETLHPSEPIAQQTPAWRATRTSTPCRSRAVPRRTRPRSSC